MPFLPTRIDFDLRSKLLSVYGLLILMNVGAWLWALAAFKEHPVLLGTAFLAYSFGLRHAVDADHIAAIDNVTRKLMQEGERPVTVGLMFSLGHSTIVVIGSLTIASATLAFQQRLSTLRSLGEILGTFVSAAFLFGIAVVNLNVLRSVYAVFRRVRTGSPYVEEDLDIILADRGFLARLLRPVFGLIRKSWHMYPLGVLFGLGFDTATEIGLLSISATEVSKGLPISAILVFPVLFAAGMSLVDTTDNVLMLGAYGWAYVRPIRKLYYNMTVTLVSVIVAFVVGGLEALALIANHFQVDGLFWGPIRKLNESFGLLGYYIVGFFALSWLISIALYRWHRFDDLEIAEKA